MELWFSLSHTFEAISSSFLKTAKEKLYVCSIGPGNVWENRQLPFLAYKSLVDGVFDYFFGGPMHDPFSKQGFIFIKLIGVQALKAGKCFHGFVTTVQVPSVAVRKILGETVTIHSQRNITFYFFIPSGETTTL